MRDTPNHQSGKIAPSLLGYGTFIVFGLAVLIALQNQYWHGEFGHDNLMQLRQELEVQKRKNTEQARINETLRADVRDLKSGLGAIEEHARLDLGLVKSGETFVQLSDEPVATHVPQAVGVDNTTAIEPVDGLVTD